MIKNTINYILVFLGETDSVLNCVAYSKSPSEKKLTIIQSDFFDEGIYGTQKTLPTVPFAKLPCTYIPFLFGSPKIERTSDGRIILYADLVASAYFMLSRYEEIIKPDCRDQHGRFLAKDAVVFQQGYGMRSLVDEWGRYLRNLLRDCGVKLPEEKTGFYHIYLTHDVDIPFRIENKKSAFKQFIKNIIHRGIPVVHPFRIFRDGSKDPYYTFPWIIQKDCELIKKLPDNCVTSIYFLIAAGSRRTSNYADIHSKKYSELVELLKDSGAKLGLHVSYEGGKKSKLIVGENKRLKDILPAEERNQGTWSRHHYLRWCEPEQIEDMERAGITDDFTLGYADCAGFRVGTCRPYRFINPKNQRLTNIVIHPMEIMECTLDRDCYMGLDYDEAFDVCTKLSENVKEFGGELVLLWHNTSFVGGGGEKDWQVRLYEELLRWIEKNL